MDEQQCDYPERLDNVGGSMKAADIRGMSAELGLEILIFRQYKVVDAPFEKESAQPFEFYDECPF